MVGDHKINRLLRNGLEVITSNLFRGVKFIAIKCAKEIVREIQKRRNIKMPEDAVTGEAFERWLHQKEIVTKSLDNESVFKNSEVILTAY